MITIGAVEAKTRFSELLDRVERGEEVVITRDGKPVARLHAQPTVENEAERKARAAEAISKIMELREKLRREGVTFPRDEILAMRDMGRR
jgi:antitoxin (DNA-binding transcriptional repressor) of toxin-antitoxin stability system